MYGSYADCVCQEYIGGEWQSHNMVPNGCLPKDYTSDVPNEGERPEFGMVSQNFDHLANLLLVGSFFGVRNNASNIEEVPYYLLQCTRPLETLVESHSHAWDATIYNVGDTIVIGRYLQRCGRTPKKYEWERIQARAIIYSDLNLAMDFLVEPKSTAKRKMRKVGKIVNNMPDDFHEELLAMFVEPSEIFSMAEA